MEENTNSPEPQTLAMTQTVSDLKHATLIVSLALNLAAFSVWVAAYITLQA